MKFGVLALAGLLAAPAAAGAQSGGFEAQPPSNLVPVTKFAVTPWIGFRIPYGTGGGNIQTATDRDQFFLDEDRGGGWALGLNGEAQVTGPLSVVAGVGYSAGGEDEVRFRSPVDSSTTLGFEIDGPEVLFVKAGLQYRLPDPMPDERRFHPAAFITVAPAMVWMDYPDFEGITDETITGTSRQFALNLGFEAVTLLNSRGLSLSFGLEDYVTFFDSDRARARDRIIIGSYFEDDVAIDYDYSYGNVLLFRAGISWRF
jgi:hypothetical protein